ncbi:MAG: hypothetical protein HYW05_01755 [Candidatus Diapherotrites archaeon]|nr:hypothetical protein [Candidatus Diapherotrites archaeon]
MEGNPSREFGALCEQIKNTARFMVEPLNTQKSIIKRIGLLSKKLNKPIPNKSKAAIGFFEQMYKEQKAPRRMPRVIRRIK